VADVASDVTIGMLGRDSANPSRWSGRRLRTLVIRLVLDQVAGHGAY
jgi:hypothetical protein